MSSINPNNIDGTYPIAGQDNDSQGFRDNFTNIKNNFTFAYNELTDLQSKVVLKSALSGGSISNDMNYAQLISPQLIKAVETQNNLGSKTGSFTISWADAHYQFFTTSGDCTLAFSNWPTSNYWTKLRLQITTDSSDRTITFPAAVSLGLRTVQGFQGSQVVKLARNGTYLFELTTSDNGGTITIRDLLRSPQQITDIVNPTANVAITANIGTSRLHIAPTGAIVSFGTIVTLPNANIHATTVSISSNVAVSALQVVPSLGTTLDPSGNVTLSAGTTASYYYDSTSAKWYKIS
jgi:hypothetical protein